MPATRFPARVVRRLGEVPDRRLAEELGVSTETVRRKRMALNIPPCRRELVWTAERDALLGTMPDAALARRLKASPNAVKIRRHRVGVAPYAEV